jgi:hypothetical protein
MNREVFVCVSIVVLATVTGVDAHTELDAPNGGETLQAGAVFDITWRETVAHTGTNWDLYYSTSGDGGPWIEIASDLFLPPGASTYSYAWMVPNSPSDRVRVRVYQDNDDADYEDVSDADLTIIAATTIAEVVELEPMQDASLYEEDDELANGSGSYLFTGATASQNGGAERRALLAFDIEGAIPAGATITDVELGLTVSRTISGDQTIELRRISESWGEGPSDPGGQEGAGAAAMTGDTTWAHRSFPDNLWGSVGGSFAGSASGSTTVGSNGRYVFSSSPGMIGDVQQWLDSPSTNYGWAVVMPDPPIGGAKRFNSRENTSPSTRPILTVTYEGGGATTLSEQSVIPAAARVEGVGGSFFVTTADVHNAGTSSVSVQFAWLPRNSNNSDPTLSAEFVLAAGETRRFDDFLFEVFGLDEGVGAAMVLADSSTVEVMTRTFNQGDEGTFGQSLPGVPINELIPAETRALVLFLTENGDLRSNLGLVNGVNEQITVRWELFASDGSSLGTGQTSLQPWGNRQLNQVLGDFAPIEAAYAHVWTTTAGGAFTCYGSVLDNQTSDPTTVLPE